PRLPQRHHRAAVPGAADARADQARVPAPGDAADHRLADRRRAHAAQRRAARRRPRGHGDRRRPEARARRVTAAVEEVRRDVQTDSVTFAFGDVSTALYGLFRLALSGTGTGPRQGSALAILF